MTDDTAIVLMILSGIFGASLGAKLKGAKAWKGGAAIASSMAVPVTFDRLGDFNQWFLILISLLCFILVGIALKLGPVQMIFSYFMYVVFSVVFVLISGKSDLFY